MKNLFYLLLLCTLLASACQSSGVGEQKTQRVSKAAIDVGPKAFAARIAAPNTILLDIRTAEEVSEVGAIEGSKLIDYYQDDFMQKVEKLDHSKELLIYCASGGRSGNASKKLADKGFAAVVNLEGGYGAWSREFPKK